MPQLPFVVAPTPLGTITTGNETSAKPAVHLNEFIDIGMTWKSSGNTNLWVRGDFGSAKPVDFMSLIAANAQAGTTFRLRLGDSQAQVDGTGSLLSNPNDFANASWTPGVGAASVTSDTNVAPDGTMTADTITDSSATEAQNRRAYANIPNDTSGYYFSFYILKTSGGTSKTACAQMTFNNGGTAITGTAYINTDTGQLSVTGGLAAAIEDAGTYWRVICSYANNATGNTQLLCRIYPAVNNYGVMSSTNATTGSAVVWGAEMSTTPPTYDSLFQPFISPSITSDDGLYHSHWSLPSVQTKQWWRIDIGSHTGDFEAADLILGQKVTPARYYSAGFEMGVQDQGEVDFGRWGVTGQTSGLILRTLKFDLEWLTEAEEMTMFAPLMKKLGTRNPALWCFDPEPTTYRQAKTYFGVVKDNPFSTGGQTKPGTYARSFSILSLI